MDSRRRIFISYAREDKKFAVKLADDLRKEIANVWMDEREIEAGQNWTAEIDEALRKSTELVVIQSPDSLASDPVQNELAMAIHWGLTIRPVLYRPCDPWFLIARTHYLDCAEGYESVLKKLLQRPSLLPPWRRIWVRLKRVYRPLLAVLAFAIAIAVSIYFLTPSDTSVRVSNGAQSPMRVRVRNQGGRPSTLIGSSFQLHFGNLPIETEPLVLLQPQRYGRIAGHDEVSLSLVANGMLTPKSKGEGSYFSEEDILPLLSGARLTLTAQVQESDGRLHTRSATLPADSVRGFVLEEFPDDAP